MDQNAIFALIPILFLGFTGLIALSFTRLGRALANRIEGKIDTDTERRIAALEAANDDLQAALAETQDRLDFAERALIRGAEERIDTPV
jgi:hypothetical protein